MASGECRIRTGRESGLVVIDIDPDHGGEDACQPRSHKRGSRWMAGLDRLGWATSVVCPPQSDGKELGREHLGTESMFEGTAARLSPRRATSPVGNTGAGRRARTLAALAGVARRTTGRTSAGHHGDDADHVNRDASSAGPDRTGHRSRYVVRRGCLKASGTPR